ncbi:MAG: hypothetical protein II879_04415 [Clostridia bacterium]|nr:hypothetical protein [Clostridia bacterium]
MSHRVTRILAALVIVLCLANSVSALADNTRYREYPERAVARMYVKYNCRCERVGNGTMVGRRGLITAGHLLVCPYHGQWANTIQFKFGVKNSKNCIYTYTGSYHIYVYDTFKQSNGTVKYSAENNIGYVIFDKNVGDTTGWYGIYAPSAYDLTGEWYHWMGYKNWEMWADYGFLNASDNSNVFSFNSYQDAYFQGSGIYNWDEGCEGPTLVGVYISDENGKCYGRKVTQNVIDDMRKHGAFN